MSIFTLNSPANQWKALKVNQIHMNNIQHNKQLYSLRIHWEKKSIFLLKIQRASENVKTVALGPRDPYIYAKIAQNIS
jgi:hypothetical protein